MSGKWNFYFDDGALKMSVEYSEGLKHGERLLYTKDSVLILKETYFNDKKHGVVFNYLENGKLKSEVNYQEGKKHHWSYFYDPTNDTLIIQMMNYRNGFLLEDNLINRFDERGRKQGKWIYFFANKNIKVETVYVNDKIHGYYKKYNEEGKLLVVEKYNLGELIVDAEEVAKLDLKRTYYPGFKVKTSGAYKDGKKEGVHQLYNEEGQVIESVIYKDDVQISKGIIDVSGKREGPWKEFYENGNLRVEGQYKNGLKVGRWTYYHENKQIEQVGNYIKDKPDGEWKWFYESGNLLREELWIDGYEDGQSIEYNEKGKVIIKGMYSDGLKTGEWFYEMGDHREVGSYENDLKQGLWKHYYIDTEELAFEGEYQLGKEVGKHKYYYSDGTIKKEGNYAVGLEEGKWNYYDELGIVILTIEFASGEEIKINGFKVNKEYK